MIPLVVVSVAARAAEGEVIGIVFADDGAPIAGAQVRVGDRVTVTDAAGAWRLAVAEGLVTVQIDAAGRPAAVFVDVAVGGGATTELLAYVGASARATIEAPTRPARATPVPTGPPGALVGRVVDHDTGAPIADARLFVRGSNVEAATAADGSFALTLPSGAWDLSTVRAGYDTETVAIEVVADTERTVALSLRPSGLVLEALTVRAPRITGGTASVLDERQASSAVSEMLGAEQMARAGDSDAAAALRRVTGLTVIGGKYVYVRGLGDRYSATMLNGSSLPSPEPEKRVVPLDLFPTSLLEAVVVQKTASPDRPGEFGGGLVEVRTRQIPDERVLSLTLSGTYGAGASLRTMPFGESGPTDALGFGAGHRALPDALAAASEQHAIKPGGVFSPDGYDADELEAFGEMIPNRWDLVDRTLPPDVGLTLTAGESTELGGARVGALAGLVFANSWDVDEGYRAVYSQGSSGLEERRRTTFVETANAIRSGGMLSVGAASDRSSVASTTLLMRSSSGTALTFVADDPTGSGDTAGTRIGWQEQQLLFEQVETHADLGALVLDGRYAFAQASRVEPDRREYTYLLTDAGPVLSQRASWNEIFYTDLVDRSHDVGVDARVPVRDDGRVQAGGVVVARERTSTTRRFGYQFQGSDGIDLGKPIGEVIVDENIGAEGPGDPGYLELEENTTSSDDYTARQRLVAGYALADVPWTARLSTLAGARVERSVQAVSTFELFDTSQTPVDARLAATDLLPSATVTVGVGPDEEPGRMQVRAGYGRTLSRPEFRELSEVAWYDYRSGRLLYGNPALRRATIDNVDLRWEWYPRDGESVSAGVFYKQFHDPVESVVAVSAVSGSVGTFANAERATNLGTEIDLRRRLDVVPLLADLWVTANVSLIASRVDLSGSGGNQTSTARPLQGQSPWVVNAQLSYENPDVGRNVTLLYNAFGPRIVEVGTSGIPDTYELPVHRVDLVASQALSSHWQVRVKGTNLLDWPVRQTTGGNLAEASRAGWSAGAAVTWTP